jgi:GAF domain-containing protein
VLPAFGATSSPTSARRWRNALLALAAMVAVLAVWSISFWPRTVDPEVRGTLLANVDAAAQPGGWQRINRIEPGSPLAAAGVAPGDDVRFRWRGEAWLRRFGTDERITLDWRPASGEPVRPLVLQPVPDRKFVPAVSVAGYVATWLARLVSLAIGALLVWRRADSPAVRGLALALIVAGLDAYRVPSGWLREQLVVWLGPLIGDVGGIATLWFAFRVQGDQSLATRPWARASLAILFSMLLISLARWALQWWIGYDASVWSALPGLEWLSDFRGYSATWVALDVVTAAALAVAWYRSAGAMRVRLAWIAVALGAPMLADASFGIAAQWAASRYNWNAPVTISLLNTSVSLVSALLLAWAVLRLRVFDFGLVIQRALAYSVVSVLVVAVLGVAKWLTELSLQSASHQRGIVHDAAIVIGVVVAFALLQPHATRLVTRFVFKRWHEAAESLRDFVAQAGKMTDADAIRRGFVDAVDRYTEAQGSAVYICEADGSLTLGYTTLANAPTVFPASDPVLAEMSRGLARIDIRRLGAGIPGDWLFPMTIRGRCRGALLIGARTEGIAYRPEELTQLAESARTIAHDLDSLRSLELQQRHDEIATQLERLAAVNQALATENATLKRAPN